MTSIRFREKGIGTDFACLLIAEIGINHNGDMDLARRSIDAAAAAGADAVKFQNYRTEDFLDGKDLTITYGTGPTRITEPQLDLFSRCELRQGALAELKRHCDGHGVLFLSTPTSPEGVEELLAVGAPMLKNGSDFLGHTELIESFARSGLPTLLSTGMATLGEVDQAVRSFRRAGGTDLVLLHCVSVYPAPPRSVNLRKIPLLEQAFGCPVGFSDHTEGHVAALGAVAMGARVIEKHFTLDKDLPGPDHWFSADPDEFGALVRAVRTLEDCLGEAQLGYSDLEGEARESFRLSCAAARDMSAGTVVAASDVVLRRPGSGIPPEQSAWLRGRTLKRSLQKGEIFCKEDV